MQLAVAAFLFSCQTGMRAGELLKIEYSWIDDNVLHVPAEATKHCQEETWPCLQELGKFLN